MKRVKKRTMDSSIFIKILLTHITVICLSAAVVFMYYQAFSREVLDHLVDAARSVANTTMQSVDHSVRWLDQKAGELFRNNDVKQLSYIRRPLQNEDYFLLGAFKDKLPRLLEEELALPAKSFLFFPASGVMITYDGQISARAELLYGNYLNYAGMTYAEWLERVVGQSQYSTWWGVKALNEKGEARNVITSFHKQISAFDYRQVPVLITLIDEEQLSDMMDNELLQGNGYGCVLDAGGQILAIGGGNAPPEGIENIRVLEGNGTESLVLGGRRFQAVYATSAHNGWRYVYLIPQENISGSLREVTSNLTMWVLISFFASLLCSVLFASRYAKPIAEIIGTLQQHSAAEGGRMNEYRYISMSIQRLLRDNTSLQSQMNRQKAFITNRFLQNLLTNQFADRLDIERHMEFAQIHFSRPLSAVVLVRFVYPTDALSVEQMDEIRDVSVLLSEMAHQQLGGYLVYADDITLAMILNFRETPERETQVNVLWQALAGLGVQIRIGVGDVCKEYVALHRSMEQAERALASSEGELVSYYRNMSPDERLGWYTLVQEQRLINTVKGGNHAAAEAQLAEIRDQYLMATDGGAFGCRFPWAKVCLGPTIERVCASMADTEIHLSAFVDEQLASISKNASPKEIFECHAAILLCMTDWANERSAQGGRMRIDAILRFTKENFCDKNFRSNTVAEHLGMSEKYFSRFFKENTDENFSSYVEKLRMERALELLADQRYTVEEVSEMVGYVNENTFYKAFRRIYGSSPRKFG